MGAKRLEGDTGRVLAFGVGQMGGGDETAEIGVALAGLGEEYEVMRIIGGVRSGAGQQRLHPHLGAEDRLDVAFGAGLGEADGAVEAVVVGERQRHQFLDAAASIEEREVRVDMQMDERGRGVGRGLGFRAGFCFRLGRRVSLFVFLERAGVSELVDVAVGRGVRLRRRPRLLRKRPESGRGLRPAPPGIARPSWVARSFRPAVLRTRAVLTDVIVARRDLLDRETASARLLGVTDCHCNKRFIIKNKQ